MKKQITIHKSIFILALAGIMNLNSTAQTPISNGGFENWEDVPIAFVPDNWEVEKDHEVADQVNTREVDATEGDYSLKLTTVEDPDGSEPSMGFAVLGEVGDQGPSGGISWTEIIDELTFDVKHDIASNDAASVLVQVFDDGGNTIFEGTQPFTGSQSTWNAVSVPLALDSNTPAEIMIGFVSSDYANPDNITPGSWIQVDNVRLWNEGTEATTLIPNFSFENWSDFTINDPVDWTSTNMELSENGIANVTESTAFVEGATAARLENVDMGDYVMTGALTYGETLWNGNTSYTDKPDFLIGSYKYTPVGDDMGQIHCHFDDDTDNENGILGNIYHEFSATDGYEEFILPANYWDDANTQYLNLGVSAGTIGNAGSVLLVDDLQFVNGYDVEFTVHDDATPEPNYLENATIEIETYKPRSEDPLITDQNGKKQLKLPNGTYNFTVSAQDYDDFNGTLTIDNAAKTKEVIMSVATSIEEQQANKLSIYPNPASEKVFIRSLGQIKRIKIVNMNGVVIAEKRTNGKQPFINISGIPDGQYIIQIKTKKTTLSQSIMVEN